MKEEIENWSNFIKTTLRIDTHINEYMVDTKHSHKHKKGKWHIYSFWLQDSDEALKIGIAGPNSNARYSSQHYNPNSANSNLAKSIIDSNLCEGDPKEWIKTNTYRINIVFDDFTKSMAHALEAHLHLVYAPKFEK